MKKKKRKENILFSTQDIVGRRTRSKNDVRSQTIDLIETIER